MGKSSAQLIAIVRRKCSVENSQVVTDDEVLSYINEAISSLYDLIVSVDASYYESSKDYTLTSSPAGSAGALPVDFYRTRGVFRYPDTTRETPAYLMPFSERRGGKVGYTLDGNNITVVPWSVAGDGPWRLYYTPKAPIFTGEIITVRFAGDDPTNGDAGYTGGPGPGRLLTNDENGILTVDGGTPAPGDLILLPDQDASGLVPPTPAAHNGIWEVLVNQPDAHFSAIRWPGFDTVAKIFTATTKTILVSEGIFNAESSWVVSTVPDEMETFPIGFTLGGPTLDVTMDNFDEYITNKASLTVFGKRQMDPGIISGLFASAEQRVQGMAIGRASEPEQAPLLWRGRGRRDFEDDV